MMELCYNNNNKKTWSKEPLINKVKHMKDATDIKAAHIRREKQKAKTSVSNVRENIKIASMLSAL